MSGFPIRALIADDEPLARRGVRQLLAAHADVKVVGEARDGREVTRLIRRLCPDLVFLDVQMPELDGFAALGQLDRATLPEVIFITAYDGFAVRAFDAHAVDYLVKPLVEARFREALARARERLAALQAKPRSTPAAAGKATRLVVPAEDGEKLIDPAEILWIRAYDYYAAVHTTRGRYLIRESLASLEQRLDATRFVRVHRAAIVNLACIQAIRSGADSEPSVILRDGTQVLLSRRRRREVKLAIRRFAR